MLDRVCKTVVLNLSLSLRFVFISDCLAVLVVGLVLDVSNHQVKLWSVFFWKIEKFFRCGRDVK